MRLKCFIIRFKQAIVHLVSYLHQYSVCEILFEFCFLVPKTTVDIINIMFLYVHYR